MIQSEVMERDISGVLFCQITIAIARKQKIRFRWGSIQMDEKKLREFIDDSITRLRQEADDCKDHNSHYFGLVMGELSGFQHVLSYLDGDLD